jgi:chromosome segregation ATPase
MQVAQLERSQHKRPKKDDTAALLVSLQQELAECRSARDAFAVRVTQLQDHNSVLASNHARAADELTAALSQLGLAELSSTNARLASDLAQARDSASVAMEAHAAAMQRAAVAEQQRSVLSEEKTLLVQRVHKLEQTLLTKMPAAPSQVFQWVLLLPWCF